MLAPPLTGQRPISGPVTEELLEQAEQAYVNAVRDAWEAHGFPWNDADVLASLRDLEMIVAVLDTFVPASGEASNGNAVAQVKADVNEDGFENNPYLDVVREHARVEGAEVVAVCAAIEAELAALDDEDKGEFLAEMGLDEPGLNRVVRAGYRLLHLKTYFTAGPKEVRAWTIPVGASAPQSAGVIHTDFERGFIRAEVVAYDDFVACNGEQGAKEAGKLRLEGKDYVVQDGDVIHFRFNV